MLQLQLQLQLQLLMFAALGAASPLSPFVQLALKQAFPNVYGFLTSQSGGVVGLRQSPINFNSKAAVPLILRPLQLVAHDPSVPFTVNNNGHKVTISPAMEIEYRPRILGGPLPNSFYLVNIHFHWSMGNDNGTEHAFDGRKYAAEVHVVYGNSKYKPDELGNKRDAYFVLGFAIAVCEPISEEISSLVRLAGLVTEPHTTVSVAGDPAMSWSQTLRPTDYFLYPGSLTTPPYSENVVFGIMQKPFCVGQDTINVLRKVKDESGEYVTYNGRELQPINKRTVYMAKS